MIATARRGVLAAILGATTAAATTNPAVATPPDEDTIDGGTP